MAGGHGVDAAVGVVVDLVPVPAPAVFGERGATVEFGVGVCPGVVGAVGLCVVGVAGAPPVVFTVVPGVAGRAPTVPVPVPAGMHGNGFGAFGGGRVDGTVAGVPGGGAGVPGVVVVGVWPGVPGVVVVVAGVVGGAVGEAGGGGFCAAMPMTDSVRAKANAVEIVVTVRFMAQLL